MMPMTAAQFDRLSKNAVTRELLNCKTTAKQTETLYDTWFAGSQTSTLTVRLFADLKKLDAKMTECRLEGMCDYHNTIEEDEWA